MRKNFAVLLSVLFLLTACSSGDDPSSLEKAKEAANLLKKMSDKSKEPLPDTSNCYVQFTISGYSGGTYRLEGEKANKAVGIMPLKGSVIMLSLDLYDEASRTEVAAMGNLDLSLSSEQISEASALFTSSVQFNTAQKGQAGAGGRWQDSFSAMAYPFFYGDPDNTESFANRWLITSEKLPANRLRIRGNVTFKASNSPLVSAVTNYDNAHVEAVMKDAFEHPGRKPPYDAHLAGTDQITVRGDFDVIVVDMSGLFDTLQKLGGGSGSP